MLRVVKLAKCVLNSYSYDEKIKFKTEGTNKKNRKPSLSKFCCHRNIKPRKFIHHMPNCRRINYWESREVKWHLI